MESDGVMHRLGLERFSDRVFQPSEWGLAPEGSTAGSVVVLEFTPLSGDTDAINRSFNLWRAPGERVEFADWRVVGAVPRLDAEWIQRS